MGKKVYMTEAQWNYIMEQNGIDPKLLEEDGGGATTAAQVGAECTRGDIGYDAPAFNAKKGDKFWKSAMTHNKKGGVSCQRLDKNGKAPE